MKQPAQDTSFQFIVIANTGIQICQNFYLPKDLKFDAKKLWALAEKAGKEHDETNPTLRLLNEHISANREVKATLWIPCGGNPEKDFAFFRLVDTGHELMADIAVDTHNGAGSQTKNRIECMVSGGLSALWKKQILANIYVEEYEEAPGKRGSLVMDFGNSACTTLFVPTGEGTHRATLLRAHESFDPSYRDLEEQDLALKKSNFCVLRAPQNPRVRPWSLMGNRAQTVIQNEPKCTYIYAPKNIFVIGHRISSSLSLPPSIEA